MPILYVLVAAAIERNTAVLSRAALAATLACAQAISERIFWPVPDPGSAVASWHELPTLAAKTYSVLNRLFVVDDFHWNLWSNFGSRPFHLLLLGLYVAFSAAVVAWMRSREVTVNASRS